MAVIDEKEEMINELQEELRLMKGEEEELLLEYHS